MKLFLEDQKKFDLLATVNSEEFEISLAYLVDIFESSVECITVLLWYKQQVTFLNAKFD